MNKEEIISKLKARYQEIKQKILSKFEKNTSVQTENGEQDISADQPAKKTSKNQHMLILIGLTIGFIFGALVSSVILFFKIKNLTEQYNKVQQKVNVLSSRLATITKAQQQQKNNASNNPSNELNLKSSMPSPDETISTLPSSNAFASFYIAKLNQANQKQELKIKPPPLKPPPKPVQPNLPPLSQLIKNQSLNKNTIPVQPMPPVPNVSMIICSNVCYAISPSGQVYTNGYQNGEYKLVVNQNQVYWTKAK